MTSIHSKKPSTTGCRKLRMNCLLTGGREVTPPSWWDDNHDPFEDMFRSELPSCPPIEDKIKSMKTLLRQIEELVRGSNARVTVQL